MIGKLAKIGLVASMLSIVASLYLYFIVGEEMQGIFVGLWAPTLINATKGIEEWIENKL
jgi:hypothetical protein|tara:strand:+ start:208 stop:384 length:177 start_codon:yes stop_codon:yes gene_type:complete